MLTRRRFLAGLGAAGGVVAGGAVLDHLLSVGGPALSAAAQPGPPLVVFTLNGGNDGLNTVVPYADPAYASARPTLGYSAGEVLDLGAGMGLNPKLPGLHSLWQAGKLAIVRGVGYPNPNLSHFASMDIWQTANVSDGTGPGWLGRWLDRNPDDPLLALSFGATLPPLLRGEKRTATAITSDRIPLPGSAGAQAAYAALQAPGPDRSGLAAAVAASGADLLTARVDLDRLQTGAATAPATGGQAAPAGTGGQAASGPATDVQTVAALIRAGAPTRVYHLSLSSFDTHADEKADHERLLGQLDAAVTDLMRSLAGHPAVVMTYSEFGRRPAENASGGTDHGTAAPMFVIGDGVRGGLFYGEEPSLTSLDPNGNLVHTVDFRSVYATVLDRVLGTDPESVLGGPFPTLPLI